MTRGTIAAGVLGCLAWEWPDTEHGIYVDDKDHVWIGGNNPPQTITASP